MHEIYKNNNKGENLPKIRANIEQGTCPKIHGHYQGWLQKWFLNTAPPPECGQVKWEGEIFIFGNTKNGLSINKRTPKNRDSPRGLHSSPLLKIQFYTRDSTRNTEHYSFLINYLPQIQHDYYTNNTEIQSCSARF